MRHVWSILCESSTIDQTSNNLSIHTVLEQAAVEEIPEEGAGAPIRAQLVSLFIRSDLDQPEQGEGRLVFATPGGHQGFGDVFAIELQEYRRYRTRQGITAIQIDEFGLYEFRVQVRSGPDDEWEQVASVPLELTQLDKSQEQG